MSVDASDLPGQEDTGSPATPVVIEPPASSLSSEAVRKTPEYKELQKQLRDEARRRGTAESVAATARAEAEAARSEAETRAAAMQGQQVTEIVGAEGLAAWQELADLSAKDPVAAARKWAELTGGKAAPSDEEETEEAPTVTDQQKPEVPPPPRSLDAGAPLTSVAAPDPDELRIAALEQTFAKTVTANQTHANRVTDAERGNAMMAYLEGAYRKGKALIGR